MQNQLVSFTVKTLWPTIPGYMSKGISNFSQQRYVSSCLPNDICAREFSERRSSPILLPGGGLEKFQGRFKEEQYFNANDHLLLAQIKRTDYRLKCEKDACNWTEYERMATACTKIIAQRQTDMLNQNRTTAEESFFLQEQKSLLERILDVLKRLTFNRGSGPPYTHGTPFGPYYPNPYSTPFHHDSNKKNLNDENENEKKDEETALEKKEDSSSEEEVSSTYQDSEMKASENQEEQKNQSMDNDQWHSGHERDNQDDHGNNGDK